MKEKDIVNYEEMDKVYDPDCGYSKHVDEKGEEIACHICYTHERAYEKLEPLQKVNVPKMTHRRNIIPLCPKCGNPLTMGHYYKGTECIVSETNYPSPNGEIGLYEIWTCNHCENEYTNAAYYAMMPIPVIYNANHGIFYTGGRDYPSSTELKKLVNDIFKACEPSILNYVERKLHPDDFIDSNLTEDNVKSWTKDDVTKVICNYFYEKGWKK